VGFLSKYFQLDKLISCARLFLLSGCVLLFSGCGGSSSTSTTEIADEVTDEVVKQLGIATNANFAEQAYTLVTLNGYEKLGLQAYWPSNSEIPEAILTSLQLALVQVNSRFSENNFSFSQLSADGIAPRYKKLFFSYNVASDDNNSTELTVARVNDSSYSVAFDIDSGVNTTELSFKLIKAVYQGERTQYQHSGEDSVFARLVSRGLVLHFLQENLPEDEFTLAVQVDPSVLISALARVKSGEEEAALLTQWFAGKTLNEQVTANAVAYYLVEQHFSHYPGSDASNSFSVAQDLFIPWLTEEDNSENKVHQYVRTSDVSDQVAVSELSRQAGLFLGNYFVEGLNHEKLIALSFDDGPSQYTSQILDVLEQAQVPASFFWQGQNLANYHAVIERSIKAGHTVANHSWNHDNGMTYNADELWQNQVAKTNDEFQQLFNITPRFYRPPYGEISDVQVKLLAEKGMKVMLWSVDSRDWNPEINSVTQIESALINNQHEEVITLMHDAGGNRQNTVDALPAIIEHYKAQGYRFVNLETLLGISDKH